jgi:hypothetical protein
VSLDLSSAVFWLRRQHGDGRSPFLQRDQPDKSPKVLLYQFGACISCSWHHLKRDQPIGAIPAAIIFFFLKVNPVQKKPLRQHVTEFDFIGLFTIMVGVALVILGFNEGESDWGAPLTIAALAVGVGLLVVGAINECASCCSDWRANVALGCTRNELQSSRRDFSRLVRLPSFCSLSSFTPSASSRVHVGVSVRAAVG